MLAARLKKAVYVMQNLFVASPQFHLQVQGFFAEAKEKEKIGEEKDQCFLQRALVKLDSGKKTLALVVKEEETKLDEVLVLGSDRLLRKKARVLKYLTAYKFDKTHPKCGQHLWIGTDAPCVVLGEADETEPVKYFNNQFLFSKN